MLAGEVLRYRLDLLGFALVLAVSAAVVHRFGRRFALGLPPPRRTTAVVAGLFLLGALSAEYFGRRTEAGVESTAMTFAAAYAHGLERMGHERIAESTGEDDPHYLAVVAAETDWISCNPLIGGIYTCRWRPDGSLVCIVHSRKIGNTVPVERNREIPPSAVVGIGDAHLRAELQESVFDRTLVRDERGAWVRAFHPLADALGNVESILVLEIASGVWSRPILVARACALGVVYVGFILLVGTVNISRQRARLAAQERAEVKLRQTEGRFRSLFENLPNIAVQGYDRHRRVIFWNQASAALYGYTREEAIGRRLEELIIPPPMREGVIAAIHHWITEGVAIPAGELVLQTKAGAPVPVFSSHVMQVNAQGEPEMYCVDLDLSDRNQAQTALAASEVNYRTLFEVVPHPMWVYDENTFRFLAVNSAAVSHYGYSREEFLRMRLHDLRPPETADSLLLDMREGPVDRARGPLDEPRHRRKNGDIIHVEITTHSLTWAGRPACIVLAQDITARYEANRRIVEQAELLDKITEAIVVVDAGERITFWNRGATRLFGFSRDEMKGRTLDEARELNPGISALAEAFRQHPAGWRGEVGSVDRKGRALALETSIAVVSNDADKPVTRLSVSTDITQRKVLQAQVIEAQKMEVIGQLAGGVAHDFNSILMAMVLNLEILQSDLRENTVALAMIDDLKSMTARATRLVSQLLLFARRHAMKPQRIELNAAVSGVIKILRRLLGAHITLELKGDGSSLWVDADPGMLDQVVLNLAVNARDAMPNGGHLTLGTQFVQIHEGDPGLHHDARPGEFACLVVTDTGVGMTPDVLARAFEPFFTTKGVGKGTGLGLATVHGIVHQHNGWISVESNVGRGTSFHIYLPLVAAPEQDKHDDAEQNARGGHETILLVEDDEAVRRITAAMLLRLGYRVLLAADGAQVLQIWSERSESIDLLLTDVVLPGGISGVELAERLQAKKPDLKIVMMSGYNVEVMKAEKAGNWKYDVIQKPVGSATLAAALRRCLD